MRRRSSASRAILRGALVCLHVSNEFGERVGWKILRRDQGARCFDDKAECREVSERVVGRLLVERLAPGMGTTIANHKLIAIGRCFCDPERPKGATCAR